MIYRLQEVKDHFELLWSVEAELVHQVLLQKWFQMIPHTPQKNKSLGCSEARLLHELLHDLLQPVLQVQVNLRLM